MDNQFHCMSIVQSEKPFCISDMKIKWTEENIYIKSFIQLREFFQYHCFYQSAKFWKQIIGWSKSKKVRDKFYQTNRMKRTTCDSISQLCCGQQTVSKSVSFSETPIIVSSSQRQTWHSNALSDLFTCVCVCVCVCVCESVCMSIFQEGFICLDQLGYQGTD